MSAARPTRPASRRLRIEPLEDRRLLAVFTVANLNDAGPGSLRQAIFDANFNPGPDVIEFDEAAVGTIDLTSGELTITDDLTINGPGADRLTIDAKDQSKVFYIGSLEEDHVSDVEFSDVTITGGRAAKKGELPLINGRGGGISSYGDVTLRDSIITGNHADDGGGGIYAGGNVTVTNSTISDNAGGGILAYSRDGDRAVTVTNSTISGNTGRRRASGIYAFAYGSVKVTVTGSTISGNTGQRGGGISAYIEAGENSDLTVTVTDSTISDNTGSSGGGVFAQTFVGIDRIHVKVTDSTISGNHGRGIYAKALNDVDVLWVTVINSRISDNDGGGIFAHLDYERGSVGVTVIDSTISGNAAGNGGGIAVDTGLGNVSVTVNNSTISDNIARSAGGGISADSRSSGTSVRVTNSKISGNTSLGGGGIFAQGYDGTRVTVNNSTISGNMVRLSGGGISVGSAGDLTVTNSTISGNSAGGGGGGILASSGDDLDVSITNSTISGNTAEGLGGGIYARLVYGSLTVSGSILSGNTAGGQVPGDLEGSFRNLVTKHSLLGLAAADLELGPLADNGGPTQTHALLPGSPAIDAGDPGFVSAEFDQRGAPFARVVNGRIDIGAFEFGASNADLTDNGFVDFEDLTVLLAAWNRNVSAAEGNLVDANGTPVDFEDLTVLLAAWTGPGPVGAPVGRRLAAAVGGDSVGDGGGSGEAVAVGDASYRRGEEAPRQAAAYGSATGVASYRTRRDALRRLQATAVDRALAVETTFERVVPRRAARRRR